MENAATTPTATHEFDFDINKIELSDLKTLYAHFEIEDFGDADKALDKESFFKCFIEDDLDGNKDAFLLIRMAAMFSSNSVKIIENAYYKRDSKTETVLVDEVVENVNHIVDFDPFDYHDFDPASFNFVNVLRMYDVEEAAPTLEKYNFLKKL
jgi:hypothetical protein